MPRRNLLSRLFNRAPARDPAEPRVFAYCASNIGAGPLMRLTRVLGELKHQVPAISVLLATDAADAAPAERAELAVLRLPKFEFADTKHFKEKPAHLKLRNRELARLRASVLLAAGKALAPDLIVADTNPHGKRDELLPMLRYAKRHAIKIALLMRDIPAATDEPFKLRGTEKQILRHAEYYEQLMVAGDEKFFDVAKEYGWPESLAEKLRYVGFVLPPKPEADRAVTFATWPRIDSSLPIVVASCGGGWEAESMVPVLLEGLGNFRDSNKAKATAQLLIFTGPAVSENLLNNWRQQTAELSGVTVERFSTAFSTALAHADMAIIQSGSTVYQILESDKPIVLLTRAYKSSEQTERARRIAQFPGIRVEAGEQPQPEKIAEWLAWGLAFKRESRHTGFSFDGAARTAQFLSGMLRSH